MCMGKFRKLASKRLHAVLVAFFVCAMPAASFAKCATFPVLSKLVDTVSQLRATETWEGVASNSLVVNALTQNFLRPEAETKLRELSLQNKLPMLREFKERTAALAQIASYDGPNALHSYMDSAEYRPYFVDARDTLAIACELATAGDTSKFANREAASEEEFDLAAYLGTLAPPVTLSQVVTFTAGIFSLTCFLIWFKNRRIMRDRRINKRIACEIPATMTIDGRSIEVTIVDISQSGANVHCNEKLNIGTLVDLDFENLHRSATVKWSNDKFAGVLLSRLISEAKIQKLVATPTFKEERRKAS